MRGTKRAVGRSLNAAAGTHCRTCSPNEEALVEKTVLAAGARKDNRHRHARL